MRPILIRWLIVAAAMALAYLFAGRHVSMLLDRIMTIPMESLPVSPVTYVNGDLRMGERLMTGVPKFDYTPEPGDRISFTMDRSYLSWPTPFEFNFMTGHSPSWKRHRYYRLVWRKGSGSRLELVWRYEQWHYPAFGWTGADMTREGATGLISTVRR